MIEELKPCPFCGGEAKETEPAEVGSYWFQMWKIQCRDCGALVAGSHRRMNREAWNRRAERTCRAWQDYEAMEDGMPDCRMWRCECGETFPFWRGLGPTYCPNCGAKVAE